MHIAINGFFLDKPSTGSGQYTGNLLRALLQAGPGDRFVVAGLVGMEANLPVQDARIEVRTIRPLKVLPGENLVKVWFEQAGFGQICREAAVGLAHIPYFAPPLRPSVKTVVTIHDLIPLLFPEYRSGPLVRLYTRLVSRAAHRAEAIITDSQSSKRDIVRLLGLPEKMVEVIPLAAEERYRPVEDAEALARVRRKYGLPDRFILYLGGFDRRKDLHTLMEAFARLEERRYHLVIAGKLPERGSRLFPDPRKMAGELSLGGWVHFIGWVAEEDKPALYSAASLFVFPSRYEGFGLPALEAMACGTPVVAAKASSLPEVMGETGMLFPPGDAEALAQAMEAILSDRALALELRRKGLAQAKGFSWRKTAARTRSVYQRVRGG